MNEEAVRRVTGSEFQIVGAANENERRPTAESILETASSCWLGDLRVQEEL